MTKKILIWGNGVGREEGENIASQMRKIFKQTDMDSKEKIDRQTVEFPHSFKTAVPARSHLFITPEQKILEARLPKDLSSLKEVIQEDTKRQELVETVFQLFQTRSQTCLGSKFSEQRLRYIQGRIKEEKKLLADQKKLSPFPKYIRPAISSAFNEMYESFRQKQVDEIKQTISRSVEKTIAENENSNI